MYGMEIHYNTIAPYCPVNRKFVYFRIKKVYKIYKLKKNLKRGRPATTHSTGEQLDKEKSRCKESGEKENERSKKKLELRFAAGRSRMKWAGAAGHMVRMKDERLPKRSGARNLGGCGNGEDHN